MQMIIHLHFNFFNYYFLIIKFLLAIQRILFAKPNRFADEAPNGFRSGNKGISFSSLLVLQLGKLPDLASKALGNLFHLG